MSFGFLAIKTSGKLLWYFNRHCQQSNLVPECKTRTGKGLTIKSNRVDEPVGFASGRHEVQGIEKTAAETRPLKTHGFPNSRQSQRTGATPSRSSQWVSGTKAKAASPIQDTPSGFPSSPGSAQSYRHRNSTRSERGCIASRRKQGWTLGQPHAPSSYHPLRCHQSAVLNSHFPG